MHPNRLIKTTLLASCALGVMSIGANADELSSLKAQLEALQSRVNTIEATEPATASSLPEGASFISFRRGSDVYKVDGPTRGGEEYSDDRGFTIAITPTADLPAPVMEVSISGYVKGDFIYDTRSDQGRSASPGNIAIGGGDDENFQAHARQSRFRIKSKSDTSVGQVRTLIEGDFEANISSGGFRLRHAWGEWDMTPDLTFGMGQTWSTHYHFAGEIPTVDFSGLLGTSGFNASRRAQVQIKSSSGPVSWAIGLQDPIDQINVTEASPAGVLLGLGDDVSVDDNQLPDLAAKLNFEFAGASIGFSGLVREIHVDSDGNGAGVFQDSAIGWGVSAGVDLPLGDMFTIHATGGYGDGDTTLTGAPGGGATFNAGLDKIQTLESYGFAVGASFKLSDASSINGAYSYTRKEDDGVISVVENDQEFEKIHLNYLWQPVSKLRMGLEGIYSSREQFDGADGDNLRFQFGTWFFF